MKIEQFDLYSIGQKVIKVLNKRILAYKNVHKSVTKQMGMTSKYSNKSLTYDN